jgi:hypothetical protein
MIPPARHPYFTGDSRKYRFRHGCHVIIVGGADQVSNLWGGA